MPRQRHHRARRRRRGPAKPATLHLIVVDLVCPTQMGSVYDAVRDTYVGAGYGMLLCRRMGRQTMWHNEENLIAVPWLFSGMRESRKVARVGAELSVTMPPPPKQKKA
jgi:hypothetical protein